ncbi:MAG: hypothetical protein ACFE85_01080 [Candidatus Hodarchaeota archaeon]
MSFEWNKNRKYESFGFKNDDFSLNKSRFHAIYFLDNLTGSLLLSKRYSSNSNLSSNEDLISSFLNALNLFINEIKPNNKYDEIQEINFKESRILYEKRGRLLIIGITRKTNLEIERMILHRILQDFYSKFEHRINNFNGIIDPSILLYKKTLENTDFSKLY